MRRTAVTIAALAMAGLVAVPGTAQQNTTIMHGITLVGELKYGPDFTHLDYVNPNAPKGGDVVQWAFGEFDSLNPFILKGRTAAGIGLNYETLMTGNLDELSSQYGLIAETMEVPADLSYVIFHLRPEAHWHDGTPITVADVIFSLEILTGELAHPGYRAYFKNLVGAEQVGPNSVRINFESEDLNRELPTIAGQMPVLSKVYWSTHDFGETTLEPWLGSGPYKIKSLDTPSSITWELDPDYWGKDLPINIGQNNFGTIRFDYYLDETVALEAFKAGDYDLRSENQSKRWALDYNSPALDKGLIIKGLIDDRSPSGMQAFFMNTRKSALSDRKVREALQYAFDFEWTNHSLFFGAYTRTRSFFENSELAALGIPTGQELEILEQFRGRIPDEVFTTEYNPPKTDGSGNAREQLLIAQGLLAEAGWTVVDGRLVNANGEQMTLEFLFASSTFERIASPVIQNMERLGIAATQRTVETAQYQERVQTYDFDIVVSTVRQSLSPGNEQRDMWSCEARGTEGGRNLAGICDLVVDELINMIIAAPDRPTLIALSKAMDRVLQWSYYVIPNWHIRSFRIAYWDKFGHPDVTPNYGVGTSSWWIDPAKDDFIRTQKAGLD